ncbi:MAG: class I SAM-dependent methyltransferase [Planctomycetes bacterium]|nr:class I SAM-dependent methyltransferase [Planctomycetota bacterium]
MAPLSSIRRLFGKIRRRINDRLQQPIPNVYFEHLVLLTLCDVFARAVRGFKGCTPIRTAVLGYHPQLFALLEPLRDFGFAIEAQYAYREDDVVHPCRPLSDLAVSRYDALILGGESGQAEAALIERLRQSVPSLPRRHGPVLHVHRTCSRFLATLSRLRTGHFSSCLNLRKLALVALAVSTTRGGCIAECGAYQGGTAVFMGCLLREHGDPRRVHTIDTFEGMPAATPRDGVTPYQAGLFRDTRFEDVCGHVAAHGLQDAVKVHKGLSQERLPEILARESAVSLALVDTDQYLGTVESLRLLVPKLAVNGVILVDDYCLDGVKNAIDEIRKEHPGMAGAEVTYNLYMMWRHADEGFLSQGWASGDRASEPARGGEDG